jgi:hypothetical protein
MDRAELSRSASARRARHHGLTLSLTIAWRSRPPRAKEKAGSLDSARLFTSYPNERHRPKAIHARTTGGLQRP